MKQGESNQLKNLLYMYINISLYTCTKLFEILVAYSHFQQDIQCLGLNSKLNVNIQAQLLKSSKYLPTVNTSLYLLTVDNST